MDGRFISFLPKHCMDYEQTKELMKLQQEANRIKQELSNIHIEAEVDGIVVVVDGEMTVVDVQIEDEALLKDSKRLTKAIKDATNKGIKKSQEIAAEKMQGLMAGMGMNLPGMK